MPWRSPPSCSQKIATTSYDGRSTPLLSFVTHSTPRPSHDAKHNMSGDSASSPDSSPSPSPPRSLSPTVSHPSVQAPEPPIFPGNGRPVMSLQRTPGEMNRRSAASASGGSDTSTLLDFFYILCVLVPYFAIIHFLYYWFQS